MEILKALEGFCKEADEISAEIERITALKDRAVGNADYAEAMEYRDQIVRLRDEREKKTQEASATLSVPWAELVQLVRFAEFAVGRLQLDEFHSCEKEFPLLIPLFDQEIRKRLSGSA